MRKSQAIDRLTDFNLSDHGWTHNAGEKDFQSVPSTYSWLYLLSYGPMLGF